MPAGTRYLEVATDLSPEIRVKCHEPNCTDRDANMVYLSNRDNYASIRARVRRYAARHAITSGHSVEFNVTRRTIIGRVK